MAIDKERWELAVTREELLRAREEADTQIIEGRKPRRTST